MKYLNKLKELTLFGGYRVRLVFRDDYVGELDLGPLFTNLKGPVTEPFRDIGFFQKAFIEEGALAWPNGYDICPDVLRYYCEQGRVASREEMNAYFKEDRKTTVLHDKTTRNAGFPTGKLRGILASPGGWKASQLADKNVGVTRGSDKAAATISQTNLAH